MVAVSLARLATVVYALATVSTATPVADKPGNLLGLDSVGQVGTLIGDLFNPLTFLGNIICPSSEYQYPCPYNAKEIKDCKAASLKVTVLTTKTVFCCDKQLPGDPPVPQQLGSVPEPNHCKAVVLSTKGPIGSPIPS